MNVLINKGRRRLGVPGRPAIILNAGEAQKITPNQEAEIKKSRVASRWLHNGILAIVSEEEAAEILAKPPAPAPKAKPSRKPIGRSGPKKDERQIEPLPEGLTGEGVELQHLGGGWYAVWVNGFKTTDRNVRKEQAQEIAKDFE